MKRSLLIAAVVALFAARPSVAQSTFRDVPDNHWAAAAVKRLAEAGIIEGRPESSAANATFSNTSDRSSAALVAPHIKVALTRSAALTNTDMNVNVLSPMKGRAGTVTLVGTVSHKAQQTLAASIARHEAPGYVVINQLKIVAARSTRKR